MSAMKMRQSLAELEEEFRHHAKIEERRREHVQRLASKRSQARWHARNRKRSSMRFYVLALSLMLTAVLVTVAMFATLYLIVA
jgi:hypothetical protein